MDGAHGILSAALRAIAVGTVRKVRLETEIAERRFFPELIRWRDVPLSTVIDDYLKRIEKTLRTYRDYERYGRYWKDALGTKTLRQVAPGDIERYVAAHAGDLTPASINRQLAFLKRVFNVAVADGKAVTNPVRAVKLFKENNRRVRFLIEDEEKKLREAFPEAHWPLAAVALHTGLRQGEQFGLRWEHVDFATGIITVPRSKHGESRRVRDLPSRLKSEYVFPSDTEDSAIDANNFRRRVFQPAVEQAGIENFRWHDLRHYADFRIMPTSA